jgi:nicotinamidase-related amidase
VQSHVLTFMVQGPPPPAVTPTCNFTCTWHPPPHSWSMGSRRANPLSSSHCRGGKGQLLSAVTLYSSPSLPASPSPGVKGWATWLAGNILRPLTLSVNPLPCLPATPYTWVDDWLIRLAGTPTQRHHITLPPPPPPYSSMSSSGADPVKLV